MVKHRNTHTAALYYPHYEISLNIQKDGEPHAITLRHGHGLSTAETATVSVDAFGVNARRTFRYD